jgi:hypothetical protein
MDGVAYSFSGSNIEVTECPLDDTRAARAGEGEGSVRIRLEFPADCAGRFQPLLQSGPPTRFDTLVLHFVRPGYVQLVHDQLGSGARWSREFAVDYLRPQCVEVDLPFADDRLDWTPDGPVLRREATDKIRVLWNGRPVFEPEVAPAPGTRSQVVLGANLLHSSVCEAMFEGPLESGSSDESLGKIRSGDLILGPNDSEAFEGAHGLLTRFERDDGAESALCWERRGTEDKIRLGWIENGATIWSPRWIPSESLRDLVEGISSDGEPVGEAPGNADLGRKGRLVVDAGSLTLLALRTDFFSKGTSQAVGAPLGPWSGSALVREAKGSAAGAPLTRALPGRVRIAVQPGGGRPITSSPVLEAGRVGAADLLYLRTLGGNRYVLGLDHWSVGATESAPFELAAGYAATFGIEMSSLEGKAADRSDRLRVSLDGRVIFDRSLPLYAVRPGEVYFGSNPLGMSTSAELFEGDLVSVRINQSEKELIRTDP